MNFINESFTEKNTWQAQELVVNEPNKMITDQLIMMIKGNGQKIKMKYWKYEVEKEKSKTKGCANLINSIKDIRPASSFSLFVFSSSTTDTANILGVHRA